MSHDRPNAYAVSGLPQGPTPLKWVKDVLSMSQDGFRVGKKLVLTHFDPLLDPEKPIFTHFWTHFRRLTDTHFKPTLNGNKLFSKKGLEAPPTQCNPVLLFLAAPPPRCPPPQERKIHHVMYLGGKKFAPKSLSTENHYPEPGK